MLNSFPVALSPLLFENKLHSALGVLDNRSLYLDFGRRDSRVTAEGIFA